MTSVTSVQTSLEQRSSSAMGEMAIERRNSMISNAPSDTSRSDTLSRGGRGKDEDKAAMFTVQPQPKNFYQRVYENKEINKLASLLSTAINSTKKVRLTRGQYFTAATILLCYN